MLYAVYGPENGSIQQCNKLYSAENEKYEAQLDDLGHKWISVTNAPGLLPPEHWYVDVKTENLLERPILPIEVTKTRIRCGEDDCALFTKVPPHARLGVYGAGEVLHSQVMDATEFQLHIPVPCVYTVRFDLWPFKTFEVKVEAFA